MNCNECPFNTKSAKYDKNMLAKAPNYLHNVFACEGQTNNTKKLTNVCPAMVWVVVYIGSKNEYAIQHAEETLSDLVEMGQAELVCALFENSPYEVRKKLWRIMAEKYSNRMYLFNPLFEREELCPIDDSKISQSLLPIYQHQLLYGRQATNQIS